MTLHDAVNKVLTLADGFEVVKAATEYYAQYGNTAPGPIIQEALNELDKAFNEPSERQTIVAGLRKLGENHLNGPVYRQIADLIERKEV